MPDKNKRIKEPVIGYTFRRKGGMKDEETADICTERSAGMRAGSACGMSVQGVFNTQVTKTTGMWVSNAWVQLSAFAICLVMWLIMGRDSIATIGEVQPKYMLLGGVIGAGITWTVIKSMAQLGPALLIVMSQLIVAYLIELVGLFGVEKEPFSWRKVIGMGIALIGTTIFQWK